MRFSNWQNVKSPASELLRNYINTVRWLWSNSSTKSLNHEMFIHGDRMFFYRLHNHVKYRMIVLLGNKSANTFFGKAKYVQFRCFFYCYKNLKKTESKNSNVYAELFAVQLSSTFMLFKSFLLLNANSTNSSYKPSKSFYSHKRSCPIYNDMFNWIFIFWCWILVHSQRATSLRALPLFQQALNISEGKYIEWGHF